MSAMVTSGTFSISRYGRISVSSIVPRMLHSQSHSPLYHIHNLNVDHYVSEFNHMLNLNPTPPIIKFGKILGSLVKINHFHTVISLFRQMELRGIHNNVINLSILMNCFCHLGQLNYAFSVLAKILKMGYQHDTIIFNNEVKKALNFHDDVIEKGFHLDQVSYGTLINGLCKSGETRAAMQVLRKIEELVVVKPNQIMYTMIINRLYNDKLVLDAYDLYSEMVVKRIFQDVVTYNALIYGFCIVGQFKEIVGLLNEMTLKNITPNVRTFNTLVDGLCKEGEVKKARNVLAVMIKQRVEPDVVTYNSLMDGYFLVEEVYKAKHVFNTIARRGVALDVRSYSIMINGLCKNKMVDEAVNLFKEMHSKNMVPDTVAYNSLIDGLCKSSEQDIMKP